ncbi:hypothetical protein DFH07DRAFT_694253, partial [Mycena maculata]
MSTLPFELLSQIHSYACTDDGSAGRALALVSKDWRAISEPFKMQSLALVGAKPILRFLCLLESTPEGLCNVQSLFIGLTFTKELFPELGITAFSHTLPIYPDAIEKAVGRILERTAATLHTLHTHLAFLERPGPFYSIPLPHLRVFVAHGPFASSAPRDRAPITPKLRRLRFAPPTISPHKGSVLLNTISAAAPKLSHLYVS